MPRVTVRYWAAAKQAAGLAEEEISAGTLAEAIAGIVAARASGAGSGDPPPGEGAEALRAVLDRSSFLVDGEPVGRRGLETVLLADAAVVEVLPPFAGG